MQIKTLFWTLIFISFGSLFLALFIGVSLQNTLPIEIQNYFTKIDKEGVSLLEMVAFTLWILLYLIATIGLLFFKFWAKILYTVISIASFPLNLAFESVIIISRWEALLSDISLLIDGMILILMYTGSISEIFNKNRLSGQQTWQGVLNYLRSKKNIVLLCLGLVAFLGGAIEQIYSPDTSNSASDIVIMLIGAFLIFTWYHIDTEELNYKRNIFLNMGIIGLSLFVFPYYLIKTRGLKKGLVSTLIFFLLAVLGLFLQLGGTIIAHYVL